MLEDRVNQLESQMEALLAKIELPFPTFAGIHVHDASTAQSIATGATYTKLTAFTDNSASLNCTADVANDKITITKTGYYLILGSFNFSSGTANVVWRVAPFLNGVELDEIHVNRKTGAAGDVGSASFCGVYSVSTANLDIDCRARHDNGSAVNLTITYANFLVAKIAPV